MRIYSLICEGACNGFVVQGLDAEVKAERAKFPHDKQMGQFPLPISLLYRLKRLVHTGHTMIDPSHAQCTTCLTRRRYGNEDRPEKAKEA